VYRTMLSLLDGLVPIMRGFEAKPASAPAE
jgi:hypothetical protein